MSAKMADDLEALTDRVDRVEQKLDSLSVSVDGRFDIVTEAIIEQRQYTEYAFDRLDTRMRDEFLRTRAQVSELSHRVDRVELAAARRFDVVDQRFDSIDHRFDEIDQRFEAIDQRFEWMDQRFEQMDQRFEWMDQRFEQMDQRFERMDQRFEQMDQRFDTLEAKLDRALTQRPRRRGSPRKKR